METNYAITNTSVKFTEVVRELITGSIDIDKDRIGLCMPCDNQSLLVGIALYDIRKNTDIYMNNMISVSADELRYPSGYYDLYYLIVPCSDGDLKYRLEEEMKILDILIQFFGDGHFLNEEERVEMELCNMDFDRKSKIWAALNQPMKNAVYCRIGPVEIQSTRTKKISRVTEVQMDFVKEE